MKDKDRKFMVLLYPDDMCYKSSLANLDKYFSGSYAYILHDKDVDIYGVVKKPHVHVVIKVNNPISRENVANKLGIDSRFVQFLSRYESGLLYLLHFDDKDKFQYSIDTVKGYLIHDLEKVLSRSNLTDNEMLSDIIDFVVHHDHTHTYLALFNFCRDKGYLHVLRRYYTIIKDIQYEMIPRNDFHNLM